MPFKFVLVTAAQNSGSRLEIRRQPGTSKFTPTFVLSQDSQHSRYLRVTRCSASAASTAWFPTVTFHLQSLCTAHVPPRPAIAGGDLPPAEPVFSAWSTPTRHSIGRSAYRGLGPSKLERTQKMPQCGPHRATGTAWRQNTCRRLREPRPEPDIDLNPVIRVTRGRAPGLEWTTQVLVVDGFGPTEKFR